MTHYTHRYTTPTEYQVIEHFPNGFSRVVDPHNEAEWIALGNTPAKESGNRFILIIDGVPTLDPNKDSILAAEAAAAQAEADRIAAKIADIAAELPAWATIRDEINAIKDAADAAETIPQLKRAVADLAVHYRKRMKILYWLAKDTAD